MEQEKKFLPVILGGDIGCYSVARAFHEQYGVKSLAIGRYPMGATKNSKILEFRAVPDLFDDQSMLRELTKVYEQYKDTGLVLILLGSNDTYARMIIENNERLSEMFAVPYIKSDIMDILVKKEAFYETCVKHGIDFPKTHVFKKGDEDFSIDFDYPIILKPSSSMHYWKNPFEGMCKVYKAYDKEQALAILSEMYRGGYPENVILQEFIPGNDNEMRVLTCYSDRNAKVTMMCLGHVLLEEHTPTAIGNHAAIITEYDAELFEKFRNFLETIGYVGFSNFDLKFDVRDGKYKAFEVNLRQGRSNYYVTGSGHNIARYVVEDRILENDLPCEEVTGESYWHVIPNRIVYRYVKNPELVGRVKRLVKQKKVSNSMVYSKDMSLMRRVFYVYYYFNHFKKFKKYYHPEKS